MDRARLGYTYGDSEVAARRLGLLAAVLRPTSEAFLRRTMRSPVGSAVDLGCGPGFTTRLIAEVVRPAELVGLDASTGFVERARIDAPEGVSFAVHDARNVPFPRGPADLVYCRLLLPHLPEPAEVVARWSTQVNPGGHLLLDELDSVESHDPVLTRYLEVAKTRVAAGGGRLFIGDDLGAMGAPAGFTRATSDVVEFHPDASRVAEIFLLNLDAIGRDAVEVDGYPKEALEALTVELSELARAGRADCTWRTRQIAFVRGATQ